MQASNVEVWKEGEGKRANKAIPMGRFERLPGTKLLDGQSTCVLLHKIPMIVFMSGAHGLTAADTTGGEH